MTLACEILGRGTPIALVHGFTQTGRSWGRIAAALAADHRVVVVDAPGHGGSSEIRLDLRHGADELVACAGRATYVGYSMGGRLALHAAIAHPASVERLVVLGATPGIEDDSERADRRRSDEALAAEVERDGVEAFLTRWLAGPLFERLPAAAADLEDRRRNTAAGLASSLRLAGTGAQEPLWDSLSSLPMPVLVLAGALDTKFAAIGRRMAEVIGRNATFATVAGAGHTAHLERPDEFLALVTGFLSR